MKKYIKKMVACVLTVSVCLSVCASCKRKKDKNDNNPVNVTQSISLTDIDLVKDGKTEYIIVIPFEANDYEMYAASELELYFESASSADIQTVRDSDVSYNKQKKYLSVGKTTLLQESGVSVTFDELGNDGYKIVRKENTVVMAGGGDYGTLFSVYEFLHHAFGFEPYAVDEIYYEMGLNFKLPDFNLKDVPASARRAGLGYQCANDAAWAAKLRANRGTSYMLFNQLAWFSFPHSHFKILPPQTYREAHPDWYAESQQQLCLSSEGAYQQFLHNLKNVIIENPSVVYIPLGGEDNQAVCVCENCSSEQATYGVAGQTVRWINRMVADVTAWMEEVGMGDRELYFPMLAYYKTEEPPMKLENGELVPIDDTCILDERAPLIFAPIAMNRAYSIMDEEHNANTRKNFLGWQACSNNVIFYLYGDDSFICFEWYDMYHGMVENFKLAGEYNSLFTLVDSENGTKQSRAFQIMEAYLFAKLMWNPNADINELTDNFIKHYYREGAEYVSQYYYLMKTYYRAYADEHNANNPEKQVSTVMPTTAAYNRVFIEQLLSLLDKAHEAIDAAGYTEEEKEIYHQRITLESFTQRYILLENFSAQYSKETYLKMVDEFEADCNFCGIQMVNGKYAQCLTNEQQFAAWRKKVQ